jgi:uncharacterized membrane protein
VYIYTSIWGEWAMFGNNMILLLISRLSEYQALALIYVTIQIGWLFIYINLHNQNG